MGIREHFKERSDEDVKIQDLKLEISESQGPRFDPETEISDEQWDVMKKALESIRSGGDWHRYADMVSDVVLLFPDRIDQLNLSNEVFDGLVETLDSTTGSQILESLLALKILFPNRFDEVLIGDVEWDKIDDSIALSASVGDQAFGSSYFKIVFPDRVEKLDLTNEFCDRIIEAIDKMKEEKSFNSLSYFLKYIRILFPDRFEKMSLDDRTWNTMKRQAESRRTIKTYVADLLNLKILAAEEIKITDKGIEMIVEKSDFKQEKKPRPERKKF